LHISNKIHVLIQARLNSSRLYSKVLLPVAGIPAIVLLYKRVKSKKYKTTILTSNSDSDDLLCEYLKKNNIDYFRGDEENVYKRFIDYSKSLSRKTIIVRLTADNLFIDKILLRRQIKKFLFLKKKYTFIDFKKNNLPYGISVEIMYLNELISNVPKNFYDKEHVTSFLRRNLIKKKIKIDNGLFLKQNFSKLNCSLDNINDYFLINRVFLSFKNPVNVSYIQLIKRLRKFSSLKKISFLRPTNIILGGAQLGDIYGVKNIINKNKKEYLLDQKKILSLAYKFGIDTVDTSYSYKNFRKILKLKELKNYKINFKINIRDIKKENLFKIKKLFYLNKIKLSKVLIHNYDLSDISSNSFEDYIKIIKKYLKINSIGISINYDLKPEDHLDKFHINSINFPINIIDNKYKKLKKISSKSKIELQARSIYLQGLLLLKNKRLWPKKIRNYYFIIKKLDKLRKVLKIFSTIELLVLYIKSKIWINKIVVGFDNYKQLIDFFIAYNQKNISKKKIKFIDNYFNVNDDILKKPFMWH
jgi:spore coat polysaccharide biosynthesis protein SpsF (cytidylyltransferase family)/aryl-alcohol dehydrogenase-like predicted oxidoreductase